jgi:predicted DNA-binding transcriptional regulator AlpA
MEDPMSEPDAVAAFPRKDERMVLEPERKRITGVGRSKWYLLEDAGLAPQRRQISGNRTGHLLSELIAWIEARPLARNAAPREALAARGISVEKGGGRP